MTLPVDLAPLLPNEKTLRIAALLATRLGHSQTILQLHLPYNNKRSRRDLTKRRKSHFC